MLIIGSDAGFGGMSSLRWALRRCGGSAVDTQGLVLKSRCNFQVSRVVLCSTLVACESNYLSIPTCLKIGRQPHMPTMTPVPPYLVFGYHRRWLACSHFLRHRSQLARIFAPRFVWMVAGSFSRFHLASLLFMCLFTPSASSSPINTRYLTTNPSD